MKYATLFLASFFLVHGSIRLPSLCDTAIFPICKCYDNETSIVCQLEPKNGAKWTISGDNVPTTAQVLIIVGGNDISNHTTIVIDKSQVTRLKLKHLSLYGLGEVNIKGDLQQVQCLYLLLNRVQTFADGVIGPEVDVTKVYENDGKYPGFGSNEEATKIWLNFFSDSCNLRLDLKIMKQFKDNYECRPKQEE